MSDLMSRIATETAIIHKLAVKLINIPLTVQHYKDASRVYYVIGLSKSGNIRSLHLMKLDKILFDSKISGIQKISRCDRNRIRIETFIFQDAKNLLNSEILQSKGIICFIPSYLVTYRGVVRDIDPSFSEASLVEITVCFHKFLFPLNF